MTLTLELSPETERKLHERAAKAGQRAEDLALKLIEDALQVNGGLAASHGKESFDDILATVRKGWADSGLSDDQVDQLFDETLKKVRVEKRKESS